MTGYLAVVGPATIWPGATPGKLSDVADPVSETLLVIEADPHEVHWMEPRDLTYDEAIEVLSRTEFQPNVGHIHQDFFYQYGSGRNLALVDGSVHFLDGGLPREHCAALLNINDGTGLPAEELEATERHAKRLRLDNCFRLGIFLLVVLWPLPWVWIQPEPRAN